MAQYIIDIGAVPDDGQGDPLRTAFDYTNENFNQIFAAGPVLSNIQIGNNTITTTVLNSNLILSPSGIGRVQFNTTLFPRLDNVYDIGTPSLRFNSIYLGTGGIDTTGGITTTGNVTAGYFIGNGSQLTGIVATTGSEVVNGTSNILIPSAGSNIFVTVNGTSDVVTFANTGMYVAGEVSATGNIAGNYILGNGALLTGINIGYGNSDVANFLPTYTGNLVSLTGPVTTTANVTGGNLRTTGQISSTGNITGGNITTGRLNAGYITTGTTISAVGNISTSSYFIGDGSQLTNLPTNYSNANVAAFLPTYTGNLVSLTGPVTTTANVTGGNLRTTGQISATGNITGGNVDTGKLEADSIAVGTIISAVGNIITTGYFIGDGSQLTNLPAGNYSNANVAAFLPTYTGNLVSLTGPVTTTANINGGNLRTTGQISATGNITGGNVDTGKLEADSITSVGNITTTGYFIGDGSQLTNLPAGNYSNANVAAFLPTYTGNLVSLTGPVTTTANVTGGNLRTVGQISATGNIIGGNVDTGKLDADSITVGTTLSAVGNIITTGYFIGDGSQLTNLPAGNYSNANVTAFLPTYTGNLVSLTGPVTTTANVSGGNLQTTGQISATGNIIGGNVDTGKLDADSITAVGNISTSSYFIGDGSQLTNLPAGNYSNANVVAFLPTYTGNLVSLTGPVTTTANVSGGNLLTGGRISATGNITGGNVDTGKLEADSVEVGTTLSAVGNITTTSYFIGDGSQLTNLPAGNYSNANVAAFLPTYTGNLVSLTGPVTTTNNITGGNLQTSGQISAAGNIIGGNVDTGKLDADSITVTGPIDATGNITGGNLIGSSVLATVVSTTANVIAGNLVTLGLVSAAGNIQGGNFNAPGGTVTSRTVSAVANVTGGNLVTSGQITATGNLMAGNVDTTRLDADYITVGGYVSAVGNIYGNNFFGSSLSLTGNVSAGNVAITGAFGAASISASGNVAGGNILTTGLVSATGNISGSYFVGNGSLLTGITVGAGTSILNGNSNVVVAANGNVTISSAGVSNVLAVSNTGAYVVGVVSATGNVTGNYFIGNGSLLTGVTASSINAAALVGNTLSSNVLYSSLTQVGSLTNLSVTGNAVVGNVATSGLITASGNVTGGNIVTTGLITAGGNISGNNVFATGFASITGNAIAGNVNTSAIQPTSGSLTISTATGDLNLQPAGNIVLANTFINSVAYPEQDTDAATKLYVDNMVSTALAYHPPVYAATTTTLALATGGTISYTQPSGASNGVGAYLSTTGSFNLIDTANVQTVGTRILVKNEGNAVYNGVYTWSNATTIVRSTDADQYGPNSAEQLSLNDYFFTTNGNVNAGSAFVVNEPTGTITFGTSNITFALFSQATTYTANVDAGLSLVGTQFNAKVDNNTTAFDGTGNIIVKASANLTTPNIGAATGTSLSLTGNINSGNVNTGGLISATGDIIGGNLTTIGLISTSGNIAGGNILSNNYYYANGTPVPPGITYTANVAPPVTPAPKVTDQWYDTANDILYEFLNDGTSTYWVDVTSPAFAGGVVANVAISGNMLPVANVTFNIGNSSSYFNTAFLQTASVAGNVVAGQVRSDTVVASVLANTTAINLQTNGTNALSVDSNQYITTYRRFAASSMPVGSVVQTVMSSSLGGSITNSTSYADISFATVTITPSSASSKIVILATGTSSFTPVVAANVTADTQLVRSPGVSLQIQNYGSNITGGGIGGAGSIAYSYQDSPGTTSAVTYKLQQKISNASSTLTSTNIWLIAMEIAA